VSRTTANYKNFVRSFKKEEMTWANTIIHPLQPLLSAGPTPRAQAGLSVLNSA